jgi:hypothetical protein
MFCHDTDDRIFWREATVEDLGKVESNRPGRKGSSKTKEDFLALVPAEGAISKNALLSRAQTDGHGEKRARGFLSELLENIIWTDCSDCAAATQFQRR